MPNTVASKSTVASSPNAGPLEINLDSFGGSSAPSSDDPDRAFQMADASADAEAKKAASPKCMAFKKDIDADLGDVLRAGCKPTLEQMSALMDNPLGNVAMLFTQLDFTRLENPANDKSAEKYNYMGLAQFSKRLNEDWNIINRVIWNYTSFPIDQGKLDTANRSISSTPDGIAPPSGSPPALIDLFRGRTKGLGDVASCLVPAFDGSGRD